MNNRERSHTDLQSNSLEPQNEGEPNRSSNQDPKLLIKASYECIKKILDLDTQSTIADINLLETINNSSTLKYRDVESYVNTILEDSETVKQKDINLGKATKNLGLLEERVAKLETLVDQLDEWSSELDVKSRRYDNHQYKRRW